MSKYYLSVCAVFKNEAPYLAEWIEYHRFIGVQHFYLWNNLSKDYFQLALQPYINLGIVTLGNYDTPLNDSRSLHEKIDRPDYPFNSCLRLYGRESTWVAFIDLDEFIVVRDPKYQMSLAAFMKDYERFDAVVMHWKLFGSSGHYFEPPGLVIENYTLCAFDDHRLHFQVKSVIRMSAARAIGPHQSPLLPGKSTVNENGSPDLNTKTFSKIAVYHFLGKSFWNYLDGKLGRCHTREELRSILFGSGRKDFGDIRQWYQDSRVWQQLNWMAFALKEDKTLANIAPKIKARLDDVYFRLDAKWYLTQYADVKNGGFSTEQAAAIHWKKYGRREGRSPNAHILSLRKAARALGSSNALTYVVNPIYSTRTNIRRIDWRRYSEQNPDLKKILADSGFKIARCYEYYYLSADYEKGREPPTVGLPKWSEQEIIALKKRYDIPLDAPIDSVYHFHANYVSNLPDGFDWKVYVHQSSDLLGGGVDSERKAIEHWCLQGFRENRKYSK